MLKIKNFILLFFFFILKSNVFSQEVSFPEIEEFIKKGMEQWKIPGLSVAIVKEGKIIYAKGFGVKEWGKEENVDENTIFAIASNTKSFVATAAMMLQNEGKLDIDQPVRSYLPTFELADSIATQIVTPRDFLCHRSGIGACEGDLTAWESILSQKEIIERMKYLSIESPLRTEFAYCNAGYVLVSEIIAKAAKVASWEDYVKKNIFSPLEMNRTCTSIRDLYALGNAATPHFVEGEKMTPIRWRNLDNIGACGGINSSATDMAKWLIAQTNGQKTPLPLNVLQATHVPNMGISLLPYNNKYMPFSHFSSYGLGWFLKDYRGKYLISHAGEVDGMSCETTFLPEEKLGIVVLTNSDTYRFCPILCYRIIDAYFNVAPMDFNSLYIKDLEMKKQWELKKEADLLAEKDSLSRPTFPKTSFVGKYTHPHYGEMNISEIAGKLEISSKTHPHIYGKLRHWRENDFMCQWNDITWGKSLISFTLTEDNKKIEGFLARIRPSLDGTLYEFRKGE